MKKPKLSSNYWLNNWAIDIISSDACNVDWLISFLVDFRNILALTNAFNIGDENITLENYDDWLNHLNQTDPSEVESLDLKTCNLQTFLDEVEP